MAEQEPKARIRNFDEVPLGFSVEQARTEASRCLHCKKPQCVKDCPVNIDIPAFVKCISNGDFPGAVARIREANNLPAICGRVCPQEEHCERMCVLNKKDQPVSIGYLERTVADYELKHMPERIPNIGSPTGKKVAVIGSGPAGLTCAGELAMLGHSVVVFEALHKPGGVLVYGIPEFRLPNAIVMGEVEYLHRLGVEFRMNAVIGKTATIDELMKSGFHAVFVGTGAGLPNFMGIPGENLCGVYSANEYLTRSNLMKAHFFPEYATPVVRGKNVAVVGGGNVAMDAARTALRLGAETTNCSMPRRKA
jgi:glutamate synthase (NADPH/NADH) small chain